MPTHNLIKVCEDLAITEDFSQAVKINTDSLARTAYTVQIVVSSLTGSGTLQLRVKGTLKDGITGTQLHEDTDGQLTAIGQKVFSILSPFEALDLAVELGSFTGATISIYILAGV